MSNDEGTRSTLPPGEHYACSLCGRAQPTGHYMHHAIECAWALRERVQRISRLSLRARVAARRHREQA